MARPSLALLLLTGMLVGLPLAAGARELPVDEEARIGFRESVEMVNTLMDAEVKVTVRGGALMARRGYTPVQVTLQNTTPVPRTVSLSFRGQYGDSNQRSERTVELGPRQRVVSYLLLPSQVQAGSVTVQSPGLEPAHEGFYLETAAFGAVMVLGTAKELVAATALAPSEENQRPLFTARFLDPASAPRELAAYVGYDVVLVAVEADAVPADVWPLLEAYAATGGNLLLAHPPRDARRYLPLLSETPDEMPDYGFGQVRLCATAAVCGTWLAAIASDPEVPPAVVSPVGVAPRWERGNSLQGGQQPLLSSARAPVGRFLLLIVLFTLVVGPGGLMLARRKGPVAVLVAVPSVALVTCVALVAWSMLVDGFSVHVARYSLTWLDRERSRAVMMGLGAWYANLSTDSVRMPASSVLLAPDEGEVQESDLDWTHGLTVRSGFLPSRTYREWGEVAVLPSRARLVARRDGDTLLVQNALGAPLRGGSVRLGGVTWELPELADGAEGRASPRPPGGNEEGVDAGLSEAVQHRFQGALARFVVPLPEGGFQARLGGVGPLPTSALPVDLEEALHLVRGTVEEGRK